MQLFKDIQLAIQDYFEAFSFIKKNKLQKLFLGSLVFYFITILVSVMLIWQGLDTGIDFLLSFTLFTKISNWLENIPWLLTMAKIGFYVSSFFLFVSFYKYLFLAIASPMYAYISERTAEALSGVVVPFNFSQFLKDIIRGILLSFRNLFKQLFLTVILFLLSFIPIVGWLFSLIILIIDAYYIGFSMLDYNAEREKLSAKESRILVSSRRGFAIGNGLIMYFSILIPFFGIVFIAPLSVIAGSLTYYKNLKK